MLHQAANHVEAAREKEAREGDRRWLRRGDSTGSDSICAIASTADRSTTANGRRRYTAGLTHARAAAFVSGVPDADGETDVLR